MTRPYRDMLRGNWAMTRAAFSAFAEDLSAAAESDAPGQLEPQEPETVGTIAVFRMHGPVVRRAPEWVRQSFEIIDAEMAAAVIDDMARDPEVSAIVLDFDSPGGEVSGTDLVSRAIRSANTFKPVVAYNSGGAYSAAYWMASQAERIVAERTAGTGSIGVYTVIYDTSEAFDAQGVKAYVVSSGGVKGALEDGVPVTNEALGTIQHEVDALAAIFIGAVSEGRGMLVEDVARLADGNSWLAQQALGLGLVDSVGSFEDALGVASSLIGGRMQVEEVALVESETPDAEAVEDEAQAPVAAAADDGKERIAELEARILELEEEKAAAAASKSAAVGALKAEILGNAVAEGRIVPALISSATDFAEFCGDDVDKFRSYVAAHSIATHKTPSGAVPKDNKPALTPEQVRHAQRIGLTVEQFARGLED